MIKLIYKMGEMIKFNENCPICGEKTISKDIFSEHKNSMFGQQTVATTTIFGNWLSTPSLTSSGSYNSNTINIISDSDPKLLPKEAIRYVQYECSGNTTNVNDWSYSPYSKPHFILNISPKINEIIRVKYSTKIDQMSCRIDYTNWYNEKNEGRELLTSVDIDNNNLFRVKKREFNNILDLEAILSKIELLVNFK